MNSNRMLFQSSNNTNTTNVPRINSLMSRMLGNGIESIGTAANASMNTTISNENTTIKRNLFGIRLNHDQLKDDLNQMWKEQIDKQKIKWNFDFETLKPLADSTNNIKNSTDKQSGFKWSKVKTQNFNVSNEQENLCNKQNLNTIKTTQQANKVKTICKRTSRGEFTQATFDHQEIKQARQNSQVNKKQKNFEIFNDFKQTSVILNDEDYFEEEEEEDEALAVPQFYKYQRRMKLNEEENRLKYINMINLHTANIQRQSLSPINNRAACVATTTRTPTRTSPINNKGANTFEPIFKLANNDSPTNAEKTKKSSPALLTAKANSVIRRPKPIKRTANSATSNMNTRTASLAMSPSTQNLIITFSENRKDTLRSAQLTKRNKQINIKASTQSAFTSTKANAINKVDDKMKQQSILDLFKQRKRRNSQQQDCATNSTSTNSNKLANKGASESSSAAANSGTSHFLRSTLINH